MAGYNNNFTPLTDSLSYNARGLSGDYQIPDYLNTPSSDVPANTGNQKKQGMSTGTKMGLLNAAGTAGAGVASILSTPYDPNSGTSKGEAIGSTVLGAVGSIFGSGVGALGQWLGGEIGRAFIPTEAREQEAIFKGPRMRNRQFNPMYESNIRGENDAFYAEDGMMIPGGDMSMQSVTGQSPQMQPEKQMLNVEKGELLIDPVTLKIVQKYDNPNRFQKHEKNPMKEPFGNFVQVPAGAVVIPSDKADRYEKGNSLTKQSIIKEVMKTQLDNPMQNAPRSGAMHMGPGGVADSPYVRPFDPTYGPVPQPFSTEIPYNIPPVPPNAGRRWDYNQLAPSKEFNIDDPFQAQAPPAADPTMGRRWAFDPKLGQVKEFGIDDYAPPIPAGGTPPQESAYSAGNNREGSNWGLMTSQALQFLPSTVGFFNSLRKDPYLKYNDNFEGYSRAASYVGNTETRPSTQAARAAVGNAYNRVAQMFSQVGTPASASNAANAYAEMIGRTGQIEEAAVNSQIQNDAQKRGQLAELSVQQGADRLRATERFQDELRMDQASREDLQHAYLSEAVTNNAQMQMDRERLAVMNQMSNIFKLNPYAKKMIQEKPGVVEDYIIPTIFGSYAFPNPGVQGRNTNIRSQRAATQYNSRNQVKGRTVTNSDIRINRNQ